MARRSRRYVHERDEAPPPAAFGAVDRDPAGRDLPAAPKFLGVPAVDDHRAGEGSVLRRHLGELPHERLEFGDGVERIAVGARDAKARQRGHVAVGAVFAAGGVARQGKDNGPAEIGTPSPAATRAATEQRRRRHAVPQSLRLVLRLILHRLRELGSDAIAEREGGVVGKMVRVPI